MTATMKPTSQIDRSACREKVRTCHDDGAWVPGATYPNGCSACGCRWATSEEPEPDDLDDDERSDGRHRVH